jgi:hypothetical protein
MASEDHSPSQLEPDQVPIQTQSQSRGQSQGQGIRIRIRMGARARARTAARAETGTRTGAEAAAVPEAETGSGPNPDRCADRRSGRCPIGRGMGIEKGSRARARRGMDCRVPAGCEEMGDTAACTRIHASTGPRIDAPTHPLTDAHVRRHTTRRRCSRCPPRTTLPTKPDPGPDPDIDPDPDTDPGPEPEPEPESG